MNTIISSSVKTKQHLKTGQTRQNVPQAFRGLWKHGPTHPAWKKQHSGNPVFTMPAILMAEGLNMNSQEPLSQDAHQLCKSPQNQDSKKGEEQQLLNHLAGGLQLLASPHLPPVSLRLRFQLPKLKTNKQTAIEEFKVYLRGLQFWEAEFSSSVVQSWEDSLVWSAMHIQPAQLCWKLGSSCPLLT